MKLNKNNIVSIILLIIVIACFIFGVLTQNVKANTVEEYQEKIEYNNQQIQDLELVKNQLHITAELLRENSYINNNLDKTLSEKWFECNNLQTNKRQENEALQVELDTLLSQKNKNLVGYFTITHYDSLSCCNGVWAGKTTLGTRPTPYKTIAVDPKVIPLGEKVEINGNVYIAEDTGGAIKGNRIDICVGSHSEAYNRGVLYNVPVYIVK